MNLRSSDPIETLKKVLVRSWSKIRPPLKLKVSEWAERERRLSSDVSPEPGVWSNDRTPYLVEIMDCMNDPRIQEVTVMTSSQVGKTTSKENILGYIGQIDPGPTMSVEPRVEDAEDFSKDRFDPMVRDTPSLTAIFGDQKTKTSGSTILKKKFWGGFVKFGGANSPASLAAKSIRYLLMDEIDRFPASAGEEGDPIQLAIKRTNNFYNRKIFRWSTPTIKGRSKIEDAYEKSDMRRYMVKCPHCFEEIILSFKQLRWENDDHETTVYQCQECTAIIDESIKPILLKEGRWVAEKPTKAHAGFWLNELYSPWKKWADIVKDWLDAQGDNEKLKVFINTSLAETWEIKGEAPEWKRIYQRRELYKFGSVNPKVVFLTCAVDVQANRLEVEVKGWCRRKESYSIEYRIFEGDTTKEDVWDKLREMFHEQWESEDGRLHAIRMMGIDSGYNTQMVYDFVRQCPPNRAIALKGMEHLDAIYSLPKAIDINSKKGKRVKRGLRVWGVGTHIIKAELYGVLRQDEITEEDLARTNGQYPMSYCHFPQYGEEYFRQLTAESLIKNKKGQAEWVKNYERNEALDLHVYNRAVAAIIGLDQFSEKHWIKMEEANPKLVASIIKDQAPKTEPPKIKINSDGTKRKRRSRFMEGIGD